MFRFVGTAQCRFTGHYQPFLGYHARRRGTVQNLRCESASGILYEGDCFATLCRCNILKINDEELVTVSRMFGYPGIDLQDKCWILLAKYNLKMLILTCGINGSYVFTPGEISFVETPKVPVADTVGAGDSFTATFVLPF